MPEPSRRPCLRRRGLKALDIFPQASLALNAVFDMNEGPEDRATCCDWCELSVALGSALATVKALVEGVDAWCRRAAPTLRSFEQAMTQNAPPVKGYEPLLVAAGYERLEARFFAAATIRTGQ